MRRQLLLIAVLACSGGACGPNSAARPSADRVAGACFAVVTHGPAASGDATPAAGHGVANDSLVVFLAQVYGSDYMTRGPVRYLLRDSLAGSRRRAEWYHDHPDTLSLFWGRWPDFFVVDAVRSASGFAGFAYYRDDAECGKDDPASHCWRGTAALSSVPCGGVSWPLAGRWLALWSNEEGSTDTVRYGSAENPRLRWILTVSEDGAFVSRNGEEKENRGVVVLSRDSVAPNRVALLTFSNGLLDPLWADFYPEFRSDTLVLHNAWSDASDYTFLRWR